MFGNFIHFIVVLLIYTTYQPGDDIGLSPSNAVFAFFTLAMVYTYYNLSVFRRLQARISLRSGTDSMDHMLDSIMNRHTIMAVMLFAFDVYGLGLPSFLSNLAIFKAIPTLLATVFIILFVFYLSITWFFAYPCNKILHRDSPTRKDYIVSNIFFSIPVLMPWFFLSIIADIIEILPFPTVNHWLDSPIGQALYFLFFLIVVAVLAPAMIQKFWGCVPLAPGLKRSRLEAFFRKARVGYSDILSWPLFGGRMLTAGVMGLVKRFRYILITPALLDLLSPEELDAVMAHETGHVKKKHLYFYLFFFVSLMPMIFLSYGFLGQALYAMVIYIKPLYSIWGPKGLEWIAKNQFLDSSLLILTFYFYFRYVFGYFMRNFERQADSHVYEYFDSAAPIISSLAKIAIISGQPMDKPNWHHFSIKERIDFLKKCEFDRSWITRHERRIKQSLIVYLISMAVLITAGYQLSFGATGKKLGSSLIETVLKREIAKTPYNPQLFRQLGDLYYIVEKDYPKAVTAYEQSLALAPDSPELLNNLAWLFATCEDKSFRNPAEALSLAKRAVKLNPASHILDTLAESYFINGMTGQAVKTEQKALEKMPENRAHYEKQLEKFKAGIGGQPQDLDI